MNVVVVVNQNSTNSIEVGNYYIERRHIPSENVLRISWSGGNTSWSSADFTNTLWNPLLAMLADRQLTNQVDYVVLSMDIPFKISNGSTANSTTAALFYGLKPDSKGNNNGYANSEAVFQNAKPPTLSGYSFLCSMLTGNSVADAERMVDQGVASDGTYPKAPVIVEKTSDAVRNVRYPEFDNAIFNANVLGRGSLIRTNWDGFPEGSPLAGFQTGLANFTAPANVFVPGAMADSLTSYGGVIFGGTGQTSLLAFIAAGASGSYGTVDEPLSDTQKFPNTQDYFFQSRGFTLAESYYQSLNVPYLGLVVAEPLAAPFAQPGRSKWFGVQSNAVLSGVVSITNIATGSGPFQKMDLFVDGKYFQTITNLAPTAGNVLTLNLEGYPISYVVPSNATVATVVTGLVTKINLPWLTNITKIAAFPHGDRIELHSMNTNYPGDPFYFADTSATNLAQALYRVDYAPFPYNPQFNSLAFDPALGYRMRVETTPGVPCVVQASTNLSDWVAVATNVPGGDIEIVDAEAGKYPWRFYRLIRPDTTPKLSMKRIQPAVTLHLSMPTALACVLQASTNLSDWASISTNTGGGEADVFDPAAANYEARFYRAVAVVPSLPSATVTVVSNVPSGGMLVSVASPVRGYTLECSTNGGQWYSVSTNTALAEGQTAAASSSGSAPLLTTFITAARSGFIESQATGWRTYSFSGTAGSNSWLQLAVTKTNGSIVTVGVTNQTPTLSLSGMVTQLLSLVSAEPLLQGSDGLTWGEYSTDSFGSPTVHFYARNPGLPAAIVKARFTSSSDISLSPGGNYWMNQNLTDLQPRNHLYVTTGLSPLTGSIQLDTTTLPDGYHELTAVAYEGSSMATQTRATLPVRLQNTTLDASLTLVDLTDTASASGTYHIQVQANTNTVSAITLFSTGGVLATATNQSTATFEVDGAFLGPGLHRFHALVETQDGLRYRTKTKAVRLVNSGDSVVTPQITPLNRSRG